MTNQISELVNFLEQIEATQQSINETESELNMREEKLFLELLKRVNPYLKRIAISVPVHASGEFSEEIKIKDFLEDDKGVLIWDNFCTEEDDEVDRCGIYAGEQIWLLTSGQLVKLTRTGSWEPGNCEWNAEVDSISPEKAIAQFYLAEAIDLMMSAVDKTLRKQEDKKRKLADRLKFIESIESLFSDSNPNQPPF